MVELVIFSTSLGGGAIAPIATPRGSATDCHNGWNGNGITRMAWLPDGEKSVMIGLCLAVSTQYRRVSDRQTDKWTDGQTDILRQLSVLYIASR